MIVTGVNPDDVWTYLGRTNLTAAQRARISLLIDEALFLIGKRITDADQDTIDYVVRKAVSEAVDAPTEPGLVQTSVTVDDGTVAKRYDAAPKQVEITDEMWEMLLTPRPREHRGAFSIRPHYVPDR